MFVSVAWRHARVLLVTLISVCLAATASYAMRVSPMVIEMQSAGSGATARIEVQNVNPGKLAFETQITRLDYGEDGSISETPADADFLIFPPQGALATGQRQVMRLQWVGGEIPASRAYYVSVNQLPVPLEPGQAGESSAQVQLIYHMKALVTVAPPRARSNVEVVSAQPIEFQPPALENGETPPAGPGLQVVLRNTGNRHAMTTAISWVLEGRGTDGQPLRLVLTSDEMNQRIGSGYVAALNGQRTFRFPVPTAFGPGPITLRFQR